MAFLLVFVRVEFNSLCIFVTDADMMDFHQRAVRHCLDWGQRAFSLVWFSRQAPGQSSGVPVARECDDVVFE